jgi:tellurite resistance protein TerC
MEALSSKSVLQKFNHAIKLDQLAPGPRRIVVGVIGGTIVLIGVALIFLPGPAFIVLPIGLAVLASEFAWARRWLDKARKVFKRKRKTRH